jgi:biopolymer transport protein ExbD
MAMQIGSNDDEVIGSINTTPLVDVMLVLLIVFLITIPVVARTVPVQLPEDRTQLVQPVAHSVVLAVSKQGNLFWGEEPVAESALKSRLQQELIKNPSLQIQIRGDQQVKYEVIAKVIAITRLAGVAQVSFIIQPAA